eukprot:m.1408474 g.1408474  ORF g.1408474 m.1408474 type:complete len:75 (+) comp25022_c1_seq17:3035-3259(+)
MMYSAAVSVTGAPYQPTAIVSTARTAQHIPTHDTLRCGDILFGQDLHADSIVHARKQFHMRQIICKAKLNYCSH